MGQNAPKTNEEALEDLEKEETDTIYGKISFTIQISKLPDTLRFWASIEWSILFSKTSLCSKVLYASFSKWTLENKSEYIVENNLYSFVIFPKCICFCWYYLQ